jgi:hypothetical protein
VAGQPHVLHRSGRHLLQKAKVLHFYSPETQKIKTNNNNIWCRKNPAVVLAPKSHQTQHAKQGDFSWQPAPVVYGGEQNPAYERSSDDDAHLAKQK